MGGSAEQINRVVTALGQMRAKQKVSAEEMNQLTEAMIPAWEILAKRIGVSVPEAMKMAEKGTLDASKAIDGIIEGMGAKFDGMMAKQSTTTAGRFSNLMDQLKNMGISFGTALLPIANFAMSVLGPALTAVATTVSRAWAALQVVISGIVLRVGMSLQSLFELMAKLPGSTGESFQKAAANVAAFNDVTKKTLDGSMKTMLEGTAKQTVAYSDQYNKITGLGAAHEAKSAKAAAGLKRESDAWEAATKRAEEFAAFWETASVRNLESSTALIHSTVQLGDTYSKAYKEMEAAALRQIDVVWQLNDAQRAAMDAANMDRINAEQATRRGDRAMKDLGKVTVSVGKEGSKALQQVSTILTDMSRGIASAIVNWKGFGDVAMNTLKAIGEAILRNIIEQLLKSTGLIDKLVAGLGKVLSKIPGLGGVFGGGGSAAGSAAGSAGGAAGGIGGAASSAVGGVMGAVNVVSGIASAVSGIVGNFQMMGMNKTLDLIEKEVRYSQIHLLNTLNKANEYWPYLKQIHENTWGLHPDRAGTRASVDFNVSPSFMRDLVNEVARTLVQSGALKPA
jgi:tape measure domain-containing protein